MYSIPRWEHGSLQNSTLTIYGLSIRSEWHCWPHCTHRNRSEQRSHRHPTTGAGVASNNGSNIGGEQQPGARPVPLRYYKPQLQRHCGRTGSNRIRCLFRRRAAIHPLLRLCGFDREHTRQEIVVRNTYKISINSTSPGLMMGRPRDNRNVICGKRMCHRSTRE